MTYEDFRVRIYSNGDKRWYLHDEHLTEEEFNSRNASYEGKIVKIEGKTYKLTLV